MSHANWDYNLFVGVDNCCGELCLSQIEITTVGANCVRPPISMQIEITTCILGVMIAVVICNAEEPCGGNHLE